MENCKLFAELVKAVVELEKQVAELKANQEKFSQSNIERIVENSIDSQLEDVKMDIASIEEKIEEIDRVDEDDLVERVFDKVDYDEIADKVIDEIKNRL